MQITNLSPVILKNKTFPAGNVEVMSSLLLERISKTYESFKCGRFLQLIKLRALYLIYCLKSTNFDFGEQRRELGHHIYFTYFFQQQRKRHFYVARKGQQYIIFYYHRR